MIMIPSLLGCLFARLFLEARPLFLGHFVETDDLRSSLKQTKKTFYLHCAFASEYIPASRIYLSIAWHVFGLLFVPLSVPFSPKSFCYWAIINRENGARKRHGAISDVDVAYPPTFLMFLFLEICWF